MNEADLPFGSPSPETAITTARPRRHRHVYDYVQKTVGSEGQTRLLGYIRACACGAIADPAASRRAKSARRLGGDTERRIEKVYGPRKIGEYGDPVDHIGRVWKWQSKATRSDPPLWLAAISEPTARLRLPKSITRPYLAMAGLHGYERRPVVIRSYVHASVKSRDWLFIIDMDAADEFGLTGAIGWYVIPGDWWLDHVGQDGEP